MPNMNSIVKFVVMVILVMIGIYGIKWVAAKFNVPILKTVAEGV